MPIEKGHTNEDFDSFVNDSTDTLCKQVITVFCKIGRYGYDIAVQHGSYQDDSGDLRSSIGWGVVKDGKIIETGGFKQILNGSEGVELGNQRLKELAAESDGISLIFVVGEEYGIYVEAMGYDVLTFSEQQCVKEAENLISSLLKC